MDPLVYPRLAAIEDAHWWFASRRAICEKIIGRLGLPHDAKILEPGCGTGGNFTMLARHGKLYAMDADASALGFAASRASAELARGCLPNEIPFGDTRFDLVVMTDVLEHLDDEAGTLQALHARLRPGGWLVLTVPAFQWLWSGHDAALHHRRRYRAGRLRNLARAAGFTVVYLTYFNFILFPVIAGVRIWQRMRGTPTNGNHDAAGLEFVMPARPTNEILRMLFSSERHLLGKARIPLGVSLMLVARA